MNQGPQERHAKLQPNGSSTNVKAVKSEKELSNSHPLLTKANSTKDDPSAKFVSSGPSAATDNEKMPNPGNLNYCKFLIIDISKIIEILRGNILLPILQQKYYE